MLLAIESSTPRASLALYDQEAEQVIWSRDFSSERAHNAVIFAPLAEALDRCGRKLDLIAVGRGPGSYGGVRVGIAVAQGLSLALGAPAIGLSSLEAMGAPESSCAVIGDARRQSWFVARIEQETLAGEPLLLDREGLLAELNQLRHDGVPILTADAALAAEFSPYHVVFRDPGAEWLARRAAALDPSAIARLAAEPLEPHYLRPPHITEPAPRRASASRPPR